MDLRITPQTRVQRELADTRRLTDGLALLQEQISSGSRLQAPSVDPLASVRVLASKAQDLRLDSFLSSVSDARTTLDQGVSSLRSASDIFTKAKELAIEGSSSVNDTAADTALAQQVDTLLTDLVNVANSKSEDKYQFGGTATRSAPFAVTSQDPLGRPQAVAYLGANERARASVGLGQSVDTFYTGREIFLAQQRGKTVYTGSTGAAPGTGTDSATGQGTLLVSHTTTTYGGGSGVQAGTGSGGGDTIIGPAGAYTLTVQDTSGNGSAGTVSLNGGPPVAFTNSNTNLQVVGPAGEVVFVNTTAIAHGFNGTVPITANGTLSVDGGATSVPINFSSNQVVTNGTTGAVTNVDSTNIRRTGTDQLSYTGAYDAFQVLMALRDDLRNVQGLPETQRLQLISQRLAEIDRVQANILGVVGQQSASLQNLDAVEQRAQDLQLSTRKLTSDLEGTDLSSAVVNLQAEQNQLQATLATISRIGNLSLLDFLQ